MDSRGVRSQLDKTIKNQVVKKTVISVKTIQPKIACAVVMTLTPLDNSLQLFQMAWSSFRIFDESKNPRALDKNHHLIDF
jgi:hypothetical protein